MKAFEARVFAATLTCLTIVPLSCGGDDESRKPVPGPDAGDSGPGGRGGGAGSSNAGRGGTGTVGGTGGSGGSGAVDGSVGSGGTSGVAGTSGSGGSAGTSGGAGTGGTGGSPGDAAAGVTLTELPVGLSQVARTYVTCDIVQDSQGAFLFSEAGGSVGNWIRKLSADLAQITTVAGGIDSGSVDGAGTVARFSSPCGLAIDPQDNLYVADSANATIRRVTPAGVVSTLAGLAGMPAFANGTGNAARFGQPFEIARGPDGDLYVADVSHSRIRRMTPAGVVTTYAGGNSATLEAGHVDGAPDAARFNQPRSLAIAANGDVYVADRANSRIRRIVRSGTAAGSVETFAGNGQFSGSQADVDGVGTAAGIRSPAGIALLGGALFSSDFNGLLRRIDLTTRAVTTFTGSRANSTGFADGTGPTVRMDLFEGLTTARDGSLFAVMHPGAIRRITAAGVVTTIMSNPATIGVGTARTTDDGVTRAREQFQEPSAIALDTAGNAFVTDKALRTVRRITPSGQVSLVAGLAGSYHGGIDGLGSEAQFADLNAITADTAGNQYVGDKFSVRKIAADGRVTTLAGSVTEFGSLDGLGAAARFQGVRGIAVDGGGNVFVGDSFSHAIRRIDPAGNVTTWAGALSQPGVTDGPRASARFNNPAGLAFGPGGALYVAETGNCAIRRIASDGTVSTLTGGPGFCTGSSPLNLAVAADGAVFFTDQVAHSVRQILPNGTVVTVIPKSVDSLPHLGPNGSIYQPAGIAMIGPKELLITTRISLVIKANLP